MGKLRGVDLSIFDLGVTKLTEKGFLFCKVAEGYKDLVTGLIWEDPKKEKLTHYETIKKYGNKLPTKEEFEVAEQHGFRDALDISSGWFWSSSVVPSNTDYAYDFDGFIGVIYYVNRDNKYGAALCVSGR